MNNPPTKFVIPRASHGEVRAVYSRQAQQLLGAAGEVSRRRASHVESGADISDAAVAVLVLRGYTRDQIRTEFRNCWFADMTPTGRDVVLGPFAPEARDEALQDELQWLYANGIPVPEKNEQ